MRLFRPAMGVIHQGYKPYSKIFIMHFNAQNFSMGYMERKIAIALEMRSPMSPKFARAITAYVVRVSWLLRLELTIFHTVCSVLLYGLY